jgi:hypothetical protein
MSGKVLARTILVMVIAAFAAAPANAQKFHEHDQKFAGTFSGFHELGALATPTGAILSNGTGTIELVLDTNAQTLTYTLTYSGLTSNVTQSHIHFGRNHNAGGIFIFLCTNLGNGPAGTPACPAAGGTVSGTITAAGVLAVPSQNITAGDFNAVVGTLTNKAAYANIHTVNFPGGEIRAEVRRQDNDHDGNDHDR